jgi:transcriptional repressor NrdR
VCLHCKRRFTSYERIELVGLTVIKRDGSKEPYLRHKIELGLRKALEKRPVIEEQFQKLVSAIENDIFNLEKDAVSSEQIGHIVLLHLKTFDQVAYLRFASVHRNFKSARAFEKEIQKLEKAKQ